MWAVGICSPLRAPWPVPVHTLLKQPLLVPILMVEGLEQREDALQRQG